MHLHARIQPRPPVALSLPPEIAAKAPRPRVSRRQRWIIAGILVSLLLHALLLLVIFREHAPRQLEDGQAKAPAEWQIEVDKTAQSAAPPPTTPVPDEAPPQPPQATPPPPPPAPPAPEVPPAPAPAPAPPSPPAPQAAPSETPPQPPAEIVPDAIAPPPPAPPAPPPPVPAPPVPAAPPKAPPRPQPPKPAYRPPAPPSTAVPRMDVSPFFTPPQQGQPRPPVRSGGERGPVSTAIGPVENYKGEPPTRNANDIDADIQVSGAQVGSDWIAQLHEWWIEHRRYPQQALINDEQGELVITFKVARNGQVSGFQILQHSGSQWLDLQTTATFGHAKLPPFPPTTPEDEATLTLHVVYALYR